MKYASSLPNIAAAGAIVLVMVLVTRQYLPLRLSVRIDNVVKEWRYENSHRTCEGVGNSTFCTARIACVHSWCLLALLACDIAVSGVFYFSPTELRSTLLDSVCANLITHIESREDVFSFSAVYAKCASSERASSRYLISFLKGKPGVFHSLLTTVFIFLLFV